MSIIALSLVFLGGLCALASWGWFIVLAYREGLYRAFIVAISPIGAIRFLINQWEMAWKPFMFWAMSLAVCGAGGALAPRSTDWAKEGREVAGLVAPTGADANNEAAPDRFALSSMGQPANPFLSPFRFFVQTVAKFVPKAKTAGSTAAPAANPSTLEERLAALRAKEADLKERKAKLAPGDQAGAMALTAEINQYNAELQPLLIELNKSSVSVR